MISQYTVTLPAFARGFHIITREVLSAIGELPTTGIVHVFIRHTSAGLSVNENADPTVLTDFNMMFDKLVPENAPYRHTEEGPDDMPAHIKAALVGSSVTIPIRNGKLDLGTWQGIYLCEFRNQGGKRGLTITVMG
ncbi:secondary thiamine-phosphate synthase enzyme YjbQ [soil metagenome]